MKIKLIKIVERRSSSDETEIGEVIFEEMMLELRHNKYVGLVRQLGCAARSKDHSELGSSEIGKTLTS